MRQSVLTTGDALVEQMDRMTPMFEPKRIDGKTKVSKYSYSEDERVEIFRFTIDEIRKRSDCTIALCKESAPVWEDVGVPPSRCACVCRLGAVDMTA